METAPIRRLPKLERNQLIDMLKLRNLLKYKSFDEDQDLLINHRIFQREQLLDSYHWKLEWLIPLPIQDWVLISCTFPGGEITSLCWRLGDLVLVCAVERQGRHASFPGEGSPPTETKNGGGGGSLKRFNWGGEIWWGLLFLWDPAVSFLWDGSPRTEGTRNRRCGWNQEGGNARCLLFAREWAISFRRESSPQTDEWRERMVERRWDLLL